MNMQTKIPSLESYYYIFRKECVSHVYMIWQLLVKLETLSNGNDVKNIIDHLDVVMGDSKFLKNVELEKHVKFMLRQLQNEKYSDRNDLVLFNDYLKLVKIVGV